MAQDLAPNNDKATIFPFYSSTRETSLSMFFQFVIASAGLPASAHYPGLFGA